MESPINLRTGLGRMSRGELMTAGAGRIAGTDLVLIGCKFWGTETRRWGGTSVIAPRSECDTLAHVFEISSVPFRTLAEPFGFGLSG